MRYLIACPSCRRQLDVSGRPAGERFSCSCGTTLEVGRPSAHDAAVIRCSSCGAPREDSAEACRFCGAEFTLHARDLDTLCSGCMARVSGKARFCHSCGLPILVAQAAIGQREGEGMGSAPRCPACADGHPLVSRQLGRSNVALFECPGCAGLWIDKEIFEVLADRARSEALPDLDLRPAERRSPAVPAKGAFLPLLRGLRNAHEPAQLWPERAA